MSLETLNNSEEEDALWERLRKAIFSAVADEKIKPGEEDPNLVEEILQLSAKLVKIGNTVESVKNFCTQVAKQCAPYHADGPRGPSKELLGSQSTTGADTAQRKTDHPSQRNNLTQREKKIAAVIARDLEGVQYCRELKNAGIGPPRRGVWQDGPRDYVAAYQQGEPWRHRIQDEKTKIKAKAERSTR
jgi:hypothetical protein